MDITEPFVHRLTAYVLGMECYKNNALISEKHRSGTPTDMGFYNDVLRQVKSSLDKQITDITALCWPRAILKTMPFTSHIFDTMKSASKGRDGIRL